MLSYILFGDIFLAPVGGSNPARPYHNPTGQLLPLLHLAYPEIRIINRQSLPYLIFNKIRGGGKWSPSKIKETEAFYLVILAAFSIWLTSGSCSKTGIYYILRSVATTKTFVIVNRRGGHKGL